jgi:hypothetical protein
MEQRANFFDESIDRVQSEFDKLQKTFEKRRKRVERETEKQLKRIRKTPLVKRVETLRDDATKQFESNVENLMKILPVASNVQIKRLERKVNTLSRKVTALERTAADSPVKTAAKQREKVSA